MQEKLRLPSLAPGKPFVCNQPVLQEATFPTAGKTMVLRLIVPRGSEPPHPPCGKWPARPRNSGVEAKQLPRWPSCGGRPARPAGKGPPGSRECSMAAGHVRKACFPTRVLQRTEPQAGDRPGPLLGPSPTPATPHGPARPVWTSLLSSLPSLPGRPGTPQLPGLHPPGCSNTMKRSIGTQGHGRA